MAEAHRQIGGGGALFGIAVVGVEAHTVAGQRAAPRAGHRRAAQQGTAIVVVEGRARCRGDAVVAVVEERRALLPVHFITRAQELRIDLGGIAGLPLERRRNAVALALEIQLAPVHPARHEHLAAPAAGQHRLIGASHVRLHLDAVRARGQLRMRDIDHEAHFADAGVPSIAEQERGRRLVLLAHVAVVVIDIAADDPPRIVERHPRAQIDRAAQAALDDFRRRVLVDVHARHQLGRHVFEAQAAAAGGAEDVAAIEFAAHLGQAADHHPAAFGGEMVRIAACGKVVDGHAADALQGFGNAAIGQGADVLGTDRIHDLAGIALDHLRLDQAGAHAAHFHRIQIHRAAGGLAGRDGRGRLRLLCVHRCGEQQPDADGHGGMTQTRGTTCVHARPCRGMA